ncbi:glycosyltransferase family 39 protein, partial [bacterium]|nr:glycosyltransferase family 39 protein [bacterium]
MSVFNINRDLYETTEGRYAECAREMLAQVDFLNPRLNDEAHWTKPPLAYWAIAAGIYIGDGSEWGVRLYLVLSFVGTTVCVYWLGKKIWGKAVAPVCSLVYCTSLYPSVSSDIVSTDVLLAFFEALALLFFLIGLKEKKPWALIAMWCALGAAFATKGPPGLLFLLAIIPTYHISKKNGHTGPSLYNPIGILSFIVIGLGWYLYEAWHTPGLMNYWLGAEVYERVFTDHYKRNSHWTKIFTVYGVILLCGSLPWGLLMVPQVKRNFQVWKNNWKMVFQQDHIHYFFLFISVAGPMVIFCLSESRLPLYLLPLSAPISVAVGRCVYEYCSSTMFNRLMISMLIVALLLAVTGKAVVAKKESRKSMKQVAMQMQDLLSTLDDRTEVYYFGNQIPYSVQYYLERTVEQILISDEDVKKHFNIKSIQKHFIVDIQNNVRPVVMVDRGRLSVLE